MEDFFICEYGNVHIDEPCDKCKTDALPFPEPKPKARKTDPASSKQADADLTAERKADLHRAVLAFLEQNPNASQRNTYDYLEEECGTITPRFKELEDAGLIVVVGLVPEGKDGRMVQGYRVTTAEERKAFVPVPKKVKTVRITVEEYDEYLMLKEMFAALPKPSQKAEAA